MDIPLIEKGATKLNQTETGESELPLSKMGRTSCTVPTVFEAEQKLPREYPLCGSLGEFLRRQTGFYEGPMRGKAVPFLSHQRGGSAA